MKHLYYLLPILLATNSTYAQKKTTADKSRLVAKATQRYDAVTVWKLHDSLAYMYPSNLGMNSKQHALLIDIDWKSDTMASYLYNTTAQVYDPTNRSLMKYDIQRVMNEKIKQVYNAGIWKDNTRSLYTYSGNDLIVVEEQSYAGSQWTNSSRAIHSYTSTHDISQTINEYWNSGTATWEPSTRNTNTYNSKKDIAEVIGEQFVAGQWVNTNRDIYTYDAGNNLESITYSNWDATTSQWVGHLKYSLYYNSNNQRTSALYEIYDPALSVWNSVGKNEMNYDNDDNIAEDIVYDWVNSAYTKKSGAVYTYNAFHQRTSSMSQLWDANSQTFVPGPGNTFIHYYYQVYPDAVGDVVVKQPDLLLFPNPAGKQLHLHMSFESMQPFTVMIRDMAGRVLKVWDEAPTKIYHGVVPTADLPSGNYTITIGGSVEMASQTFSVAK